MTRIVLVLAICVLIQPSFCSWFKHRQIDAATGPSDMPTGVVVAHFPNRVDHFNLSSGKTYNQRYWFTEDYWDRSTGPMILYVSGESAGHFVSSTSMTMELAKKLKAKVFVLEHRFYGESQPCADWSVSCLRFLTHEQALADIAYFIQRNNKGKHEAQKKWVLIGGSYAGALVGWFKAKYPYMAKVIYSSSGVVSAVTDYYKYMDQVYTDMSKDQNCLQVVSELNAYATKIVKSGTPEQKLALKKAMGAEQLDDLDFLSYFTDIYVGEVQYSSRKVACKEIVKLADLTDMLKRAAVYAKLGASFRVVPGDYTFENEKNININTRSNSRQWMYQVCTAFGYFQTGRSTNPLRSEILGIDYWRSACKRIFGAALFPDDAYTNGIMGDTRIIPAMTKAVFTNGGDDPWQWAGIRNEGLSNSNLFVKILNCDDCAHCIDLHAASPSDPVELTQAREKIRELIAGWMAN